jgi:RNA polymerase sigma factor (sigma-70 family)
MQPRGAQGVRVHIRACTETAPYRPGSPDDFERVYRESHAKILATLIGLLGDRATAEDCAQETFARALVAWPRWRPDAPPEAWLHRIALNVAVSTRRRRTLQELGQRLRHLGAADGVADPTDSVHGELLAALRRLPPRQAAVIVLRHLHGYTNREIAASLGVPERTVASRLATAKERLQVELRREGVEEAGGAACGPVSRTSPPRRVVSEHAR